MTEEADFSRVTDGRVADALLVLLEDELKRRDRAVDLRIYGVLVKETLDPQMAVQAWTEKKAIRDLKLSLERRARAGQSSGERLADRGTLTLAAR